MLYIDIDSDKINFGIDVDGTLTKEIIGEDMLTLSIPEVKKRFLECTPKDGIDVLFNNNFNKFIITGRLETYRDVTIDWLNMYGIPYDDITMFPNDFYILNGYSVPKYTELKLNIHLQKDVHFSLDDNEHVVEILNKHGISACKVDDDFRDAFEKVLILNGNIKNGTIERKRSKMSQFQVSKFIVG